MVIIKAWEERIAPPMLLLYGDAVFFYGASLCLILVADTKFAGSYQCFAVFADGDSGDLELFRYFPCGKRLGRFLNNAEDAFEHFSVSR